MKKETIALHAGYEGEGFNTMAVPLYQTTAYAFRDAEHAANLFALKELGPIYTRLNNPTTDVLEKRFAAYEGGVAALATSSGQAAIFYAIANVAEAGDNVIISNKLYGGSVTLIMHTMKRFGIEGRVFNVDDGNSIEALIDDKTKAIFFETLSNPQIAIADIENIVKVAQKHSILTICDNTVATASLFNPFAHGIDVSVHSTSKYTTGQGLAIGGMIVERNGLNEFIKGNDRYYHFNTPDESYHGLVYTDLPLPAFTLRARLALARDIGAVPAPFNSWLFIQGLETLSIRIEKHSANAKAVAEFLKNNPKVKSVSYPGLESDPQHPKAKKYFRDSMSSGLLSFEVESFEEAKRVMNNTKIFSVVVNIGDSKSIITHPASTTHSQLTSAELEASGVKPALIRLSIGLENSEDLIADLAQAIG